jgi:hypothetical protein
MNPVIGTSPGGRHTLIAAELRAGGKELDQPAPDRLDGGQRAIGDLELGEDA